MRKLVVLSVVLLLTLFTLPAFAGPHRFGQQLSAAQCSPGPAADCRLTLTVPALGRCGAGIVQVYNNNLYDDNRRRHSTGARGRQ